MRTECTLEINSWRCGQQIDYLAPTLTNCSSQLWVSSAHNCSGYYCLSSTAADPTPDHFGLALPGGEQGSWAKTGYLGFISLAPKSTLGQKSEWGSLV